ncbi:MAG: helix-turn-helix transcriptional regulator [Bacteroidales bacterium]|nr:helix-turn-helix transcriptional regulator [Candidatus Cacconaster equifaecalis]
MKYGEAIRRRRTANGVSLRKFAVECGITPNTLSALENDKYSPSRETLKRIAEKLEVAPVILTLEAITTDDIPVGKRKDFKRLQPLLKDFVSDVRPAKAVKTVKLASRCKKEY